MRLLVIRHGESEADLLDVHEGRADFALTEKGRAQAKQMSEWAAARYEINRIYCSPLKRAYQTAQFLAEATGAPLRVDENLMEFNNGLIAGLPRAEVARKYPRQPDTPIHAAVYEQESLLMFRYRADMALSAILSEGKDEETLAVVTHGGMISQLYRAFLKLPVDAGVFFHTGDTGIHEWTVRDGIRRIQYANIRIGGSST